jgi:hypothetical protein
MLDGVSEPNHPLVRSGHTDNSQTSLVPLDPLALL